MYSSPSPPSFFDACVIVKPHAMARAMQIHTSLPPDSVVKTCAIKLTAEQAEEFYSEHRGKWFLPRLVSSMSMNKCYAMHVRVPDIGVLRKEWAGPTDPEEARATMPESVRAIYGSRLPHNAVHVSDSEASGKRELELMFGKFAAADTATAAATDRKSVV